MRNYQTVPETAARLRMPKATVLMYIRRGTFRAWKVGRHYLLDPEQVDRDLDVHRKIN